MQWAFTPAVGVLLAIGALALLVCGLLWSRRSLPGGRMLYLLMLGAAQYALVAALEGAATPLTWKIRWSTLEYLGSGWISTCFLIFAATYSGRDGWLRGWRRIALWVPPALALGTVALNGIHHAVWTGFLPGPEGTNSVIYVHGPGYYAIIAMLYVYLTSGFILLLRAAARPGVIRKRQSLTVLLAALFPIVGGILYSLGITPLEGLDLVPVTLFFSVLVVSLGVGTFRIFDLVPIARDVLVEGMPDGVLVLDADHRLIDFNPMARKLFGVDSSSIGRPADDISSIWDRVQDHCREGREGRVEFALRENPLLYVDVRVSPLRDKAQRSSGCLVVVRDITPRRVAQLALQEANRRLESEMERIESLQAELRERAIRDALTGLFNRRFLDEILPRELERALHDGYDVSAVMIDIDHFKQVNDRCGHETGDRILEHLGRMLREKTRPGDIACRYGGEEFVLILPRTVPGVARARAEEIRAAFADLSAFHAGEPVTLSAGVAACPLDGRSQDELLRAADEALYAAKADGRDRVVGGTPGQQQAPPRTEIPN